MLFVHTHCVFQAIQVCAYKLGIPISKVINQWTDTVSSANSIMSGGSVTSEVICLVSLPYPINKHLNKSKSCPH